MPRQVEITNELVDACEYMIEITGGSQEWNGETHIALKKIEKAVFRARRMMDIANRKGVQPCPKCGIPMSFAYDHYFCRKCGLRKTQEQRR